VSDVAIAVVASVGLALVVVIPVTAAAPASRVRIAAWVLSLYPVMVPVCLYATWVTAWCVLGHRPRSSLDDPKFISPIVDVPYRMTHLSVSCWPVSIGIGLVLAVSPFKHRPRINALWILPLARLSIFAILVWDTMGVLEWFMD